MSKKVLIQQIQPVPAGPQFGRVSDPVQFQNSQIYSHQHIEGVVRDLLMAGAANPQTAGFDYTLAGNLKVSIASGQAISVAGLSYDTLPIAAAQIVTLAAAHPTLPRIDLIYALLETDAEAEIEFRPFVRLRTQEELVAGVPAYSPQQFNYPTEIQNRATIQIRAGTPGANPVAPTANAGEAPLYTVNVDAGATALTAAKVTDIRSKARSLNTALSLLDSLNVNFAESVDDRVNALLGASVYLSKSYDDPGNSLVLDVNLTALYTPLDSRYTKNTDFAEAVDDRVAVLLAITPNTGLQKTYDDPGNALNLAGVAVTQTVMGMMLAADKLKLDGATALATASKIVQRDATGKANFAAINTTAKSYFGEINTTVYPDAQFLSVNSNADPTTPLVSISAGTISGNDFNSRVLQVSGNANSSVEHNGPGLLDVYDTNSTNFYGCRHSLLTLRGYTPMAFKVTSFGDSYMGRNLSVAGNLSVVGSISKGSGTFRIDHPLDPMNKLLYHGFVESSEYLLIYRVAAKLENGRATVDLDQQTNMTKGTFAVLAQNAEVVSLFSRSKSHLEVSEIEDGEFDIVSDDPADSSKVVCVVMAARQDAFIKTVGNVDGDGRLVPEQLKPEATAAELAELQPTTNAVKVDSAEEKAALEDSSQNEEPQTVVVTSLLGKKGFPIHTDCYDAEAPTRIVTHVVEVKDPSPSDEAEIPIESPEVEAETQSPTKED